MIKGMMHEGCKINEKVKLKRKTKQKKKKKCYKAQSKHDMLRMMEYNVNLGMTQTQEHVIRAKRSKKT